MNHNGLKVLVVEDDRPWFRTLRRALLRLGASDVVAADRIGRGWELAREESWDAAILDVMLPDGHGLELLEALRREQPRLPVLVQTATRDWTLINEAQRLHARFLVKPFDEDHLRAFVDAAMEEKALRDSAPDVLLTRLASEHHFTPTEQTMLLLLARGTRRSTIARERGVAEGTVKTQIQAMLRKARAGSVLELLGRALYPEGAGGAPPAGTSLHA